MKNLLRGFLIFTFLLAFFRLQAQNPRPADIAQKQLKAYNQQDIANFLSWYADDVEVYNFPNELIYQGKEQMRKIYTAGWARNPKQKAKVTERMTLGNTVVDKEYVTGRANGVAVQVIAIYKIEDNKIKQVYFVRP